MQTLILFLKEGALFDKVEIKRIFEEIAGTYDFREEGLVGSALECSYVYNQDQTEVRLKDNMKSISISGTGDASLKVVLELQTKCKSSLQMTDSNYGFELSLKEIASVEKLRSAIAPRCSSCNDPLLCVTHPM